MLDSSPVLIHHQAPPPAPPRRSLKRSASVASLPTPPRTASDKKRVRREPRASDSDEEEETFVAPVARVLFKPKGSSTVSSTSGKVVEENPFWVAPEEEETEEPRTISLKKTLSVEGAPASPPPSRTNQVPLRLTTPPPSTKPVRKAETPKTPVQTKREEAKTPAEDSGKLPFLVESPNNPFVTRSEPSTPKAKPREVTPVLEEKPTVTYVFRGKKIEFTNPLYNLPDEAFKKSRLPVEHEEYSPPPVFKPQRLFKEEAKALGRRRRTSKSPTQTTPTRTSTRLAAKKPSSPKKAS